MSTYSCRCSEQMVLDLQSEIITHFNRVYPKFYSSKTINLDFHSIPHFGEESEMEKVWCGAKGKSMKGANSIIAHDSGSNAIMYTRADILRSEEAEEIKKFIAYWKKIKGEVNETLVFDYKFTTYKVLDEISKDVKFITLRKRNAAFTQKTSEIPESEWDRMHIPIPKRKWKNISVHEERVTLTDCNSEFRQITIKNHGRANPTVFKKFINIPGKISYDGKNFTLGIRKRAHTPILLGLEKLTNEIKVSWLDGKSLLINWLP